LAVFGATLALTAGLAGAFRGKNPSSSQAQSPPSSSATQASIGQPASARDCNRNSFIGTVQRRIVARAAPDLAAPGIRGLAPRTTLGTPQVVLVLGEVRRPDGGTWYRVQLPAVPSATGFLPAAGVTLAETSYRLALDRKSFRLTLFNGCTVVKQFAAGVGTGRTRPPTGRSYLTALLKLPEPDRLYGTYAYSLAGFTGTLSRWSSGAIVGLHGTLDPSALGKDDPRGSIAVSDSDIQELVQLLPLGTPIELG
jgi:hypothetical protein